MPADYLSMLPEDFTLLDLAAIAFLFLAWMGYSPLLSAWHRGTLNVQLSSVRQSWMTHSCCRENPTFDAVLLGHILNSTAFFGSATLLVMAGLFGTLANVKGVYGLVRDLAFIQPISADLFTLKLGLVGLVLTISFFSFTYALRKLIYSVALIGALSQQSAPRFSLNPSLDPSLNSSANRQASPAVEDAQTAKRQERMVAATATVLTAGLKSFNSGIRGYYFGVAALFYFVSAQACLLVSALVLAMLIYRQIGTPTARAIRDYVDALN